MGDTRGIQGVAEQ